MCTTSANSKDFLFLEAMRDAYLTQLIDVPTRGRGNDTPSTLDLMITNDNAVVGDIRVDAPLGKSDHALISARVVCQLETKPITKTRFIYDKANYEEMRRVLDIDWEDTLNACGNDINKMWKTFKSKMEEAEKLIPKKVITINDNKRKYAKPLDRKTLAKIKRKNRLWERYTRSNDGKAYLEYCKVENQVRGLTRKAEKAIERAACKKVKKKFWQFDNRKTKNKVSIPDLVIDDDVTDPHIGDDTKQTKHKTTNGDKEKADVLNKYFSTVFTVEDTLYEKVIPNKTDSKLLEIHISVDKVMKKLQKLKIGKSPGPDGIHPRVLKELTAVISLPLTILFNASLELGKLPDEWRTANITAIYKKGSRHVCGNYRPVSLTCIACKVLESIVREELIDYLKKNKLFSNKQFGFLGGRSTTLQLLKVIDNWTDILDRGGSIDVLYFDFMKAFDKVPHQRLLMKLKSYGINGAVLNWISAFLSNRRQRVIVNGQDSEWSDVTSGVPQGSVLGPVLFVLYINDLPDVVDAGSNIYMFSDDTKLYREIKDTSDEDILQNDIDKMNEWSDDWLMSFHPAKCKVLKIGRPVAELTDLFNYYTLRGHKLEVVQSEKDIGVVIDCDLSFDIHIAEKVNKATRLVNIIRRSFMYLDEESFLCLYKSIVRPHLEYANQVWAPRLQRQIDSVENVQRRATKLIPGFDHLEYEERLKKLKLPTLTYRRLRGDLIETFKILSKKYDPDVCEGFIDLREDSITRGHSLKIFKHGCRLNVRKNCFPNRIVDVWNALPEQVVSAKSVESFEGRLDKFLRGQDFVYDYRANIKIAGTGSQTVPVADYVDLVPEA